MSDKCCKSRRDFLKASAATAAVVAANPLSAATPRAKRWTSPKQINPNIDNLRVVFAHDPEMVNTNVSGFSNFSSMSVQNGYANNEKIVANMDKMAIALTEKSSAADAWKTIFMKPESKSWSQVKVAMKVNGIGTNHPRLAVVNKVCEELINLGVQASNIHIYDSCHGSENKYTSFIGSELPAGVVVQDLVKSGFNIPVNDSGKSWKCTNVLVEGSSSNYTFTKDILINFAVCKNHGAQHGKFTMTLKNHIGSLKFNCPNGSQDLADLNMNEAILGDFSDPSTPVRQQLCIIDALWSSSRGGPSATPDVDTHRLIMGTSSPIVDYLTGMKVRGPVVGDTPNISVIEEVVEEFGHSLSDVQDLDMVDALDYIGTNVIDTQKDSGAGKPKNLTVKVAGNGFQTSQVSFHLPGEHFVSSLTIYSMRGEILQHLQASDGGSSNRVIEWNGESSSGTPLAAGMYIIKCVAGNHVESARITLSR